MPFSTQVLLPEWSKVCHQTRFSGWRVYKHCWISLCHMPNNRMVQWVNWILYLHSKLWASNRLQLADVKQLHWKSNCYSIWYYFQVRWIKKQCLAFKFFIQSFQSNIMNIFSYKCVNPIKKIVDLTNPSASLLSNLNVTCLVNGKYSVDVLDYGCIGKYVMTNSPCF